MVVSVAWQPVEGHANKQHEEVLLELLRLPLFSLPSSPFKHHDVCVQRNYVSVPVITVSNPKV